MAGAGYKLFNSGDVLTAAQVNTYLMEQTVMVFNDAAARTTALSGVLSEGMISYLKDTNAVEVYNGSAWVASDDPNAIQNTIVDAKGDLITATAADTPARLASSGVNGDVLTVDTSTATGLKWAAAAASSPLTTKGDLYTYSTTNARLGVGANGESLVADSTTTTGLRWQADWNTGKNKIINGDFRINARAFSSTTTSGTYGFDRWLLLCSNGTVTYSTQAFTPGAAPVAGYEGTNFARIASTGQTATSAFSILAQRIEDTRTIAGQTVVVSFWAKAASGTPKVAVEFEQTFGTGGSPSAAVTQYAGQVTLSTSWARYSVSVAVPSISGKTFGTDNNSFTALYLFTSAGSDFNARTGSLGIQTATIDFWGVQVEAGSVATPFTTATGTLQGELAACQRYYVAFTRNDIWAVGQAIGTATAIAAISFPFEMRGTPSVTLPATGSGAGQISFLTSTGGYPATLGTINAGNITKNGFKADTSTSTGAFTAGNASALYVNGETIVYRASAEL